MIRSRWLGLNATPHPVKRTGKLTLRGITKNEERFLMKNERWGEWVKEVVVVVVEEIRRLSKVTLRVEVMR